MSWKEALVGLGVIGFFAGILWLADQNGKEAQVASNKCSVSCGVLKSKIIDNACYCATEKSWELKK